MRVYLAATGELYYEQQVRKGISCNVKRLLVSYTSASWGPVRLSRPLEKTSPTDYCVDSGAHVWLSSYFKKGEKRPIADVERHLANFMSTVEHLESKPTFVVELDLQHIYGADIVDGWRRDLWMPFEQRTGIRVCYVWHSTDEDAGWARMLSDPHMRYLGLGSKGATDPKQRARMVMLAYKAGKPVHGFASVNASWIRNVPFYSVDSTSWAAGTFFGTVPVFDPNKGTVRQLAVGRNAMRKDPRLAAGRLASAGGKIKVKDLVETDGQKQDFSTFYQQAADAYLRFENHYTAYWRRRGVDWSARLGADEPPGQ